MIYIRNTTTLSKKLDPKNYRPNLQFNRWICTSATIGVSQFEIQRLGYSFCSNILNKFRGKIQHKNQKLMNPKCEPVYVFF